ncbi:hypothetical protein VPH35_003398 [Triticum aestivum]
MLGCLMGSCSSAGWCKAQLLCGSSPVGRCSGATPACTEYCLGYSLPRPRSSTSLYQGKAVGTRVSAAKEEQLVTFSLWPLSRKRGRLSKLVEPTLRLKIQDSLSWMHRCRSRHDAV